MRITTEKGNIRVAILIPSSWRADVLRRTLRRQSFLNHPDTFVGIDELEREDYRQVIAENPRITWVFYRNAEHSLGFVREQLRRAAMEFRPRFQWFLITDDNAGYTEESVQKVVRCAVEWPEQPVIMSGFNDIMKFFHQGKEGTRPKETTVNGLTSFQAVGYAFYVIPRKLYENYTYPVECLTYEDRHHTFTLLKKGFTNFRVCVNAGYTKARHKPGGTGDLQRRMYVHGISMIPMARDFPMFMGCNGVFTVKWKFLMKMAEGYRFTKRLPGGSRWSEAESLQTMVKE